MRKAISLIIATCLFVGGIGYMISVLLYADHFRFIVVIASGFVAFLGAAWLYEDFIKKASHG